MLDPSALEVFSNSMQDDPILNGDIGSDDSEEDEVNEIPIEKLSVSDRPGSVSSDDVQVTRKTTTRRSNQVRDTGLFKNAVPAPFASLPYTKTIPIEDGGDDLESFGRENGEDEYEDTEGWKSAHQPEGRGRASLDRSDVGPRHQRSQRREIIPDDPDDFLFQGQRMRIGPKQKQQKIQGGKKFLRKVQHELEEQREEWKSEVERMLQGSNKISTMPKNSQTGGTNSFVDTTGPEPVYKAFFDVSDFPPSSIAVSIDKLQNKVVVQANQASKVGNLSKSFTQKVQLPRFADEHRLTSKLSKKGILKVEVPLMYYFDETADKKAKSFVNEVKTNPRSGQQSLEILVNTDPNIRAKDLHVQVEDGKLVIFADTLSSKTGKPKQKLIKEYTLPALADPDRIRSRLGRDGRLAIAVPLRRVDRSLRESAGSPGVRTIKHEVTKQYNGSTPPSGHQHTQQMRFQTLDTRPTTSIHQMTTPSRYKSEPILYEPSPRSRRRQPTQTVEQVKVVKSRKTRRK